MRVRVRSNGLAVTVSLRGGRAARRYGKSFYVGWSARQQPGADAPEVTLEP